LALGGTLHYTIWDNLNQNSLYGYVSTDFGSSYTIEINSENIRYNCREMTFEIRVHEDDIFETPASATFKFTN
jgi:hypothetical protein